MILSLCLVIVSIYIYVHKPTKHITFNHIGATFIACVWIYNKYTYHNCMSPFWLQVPLLPKVHRRRNVRWHIKYILWRKCHMVFAT